MPIDIYCQKIDGRLIPETGFDAEQMDKLPRGKPVRCRITQPRSDGQQRWYWKLLSRVAENTEFPDAEAVHFYLRMRVGLYDHVVINAMEHAVVPRSTAYGAMDQTDFNNYVEQAVHVIETVILPGVTVDEALNDS